MKSTDELNFLNIPCKIIKHVGSGHTALQAASEIGLDVSEIIKTLVLGGQKTGVILFLIPGDKKFDLRKIRHFLGDKSIDLLDKNEVLIKTGYPVGLVTSFGIKEKFKIFADKTVEILTNTGISSGELGSEIIMNPSNLLKATNAILGDFVK